MTTQIQYYINFDAKDFLAAFSDSIDEIQHAIAEEVKNAVGDNEHESERIRDIFLDIVGKTRAKHTKNGGSFDDCFNNESNKAISQGTTFKEFQLSRLIYVSGLTAGYLYSEDQDDDSNKLTEAFKFLSLANSYLGEYQNNIVLNRYFNFPFKKKPQENFKRCTLLKLIFGMANHGYNCNSYNKINSATHISTKLKNIGIQVNSDDIIKYLREAYDLKEQWKKKHANEGSLTETERNTMLKLIIGMAIDRYDYHPNNKLNQATGDTNSISTKIQGHVFVNDGTLRACLEAAKKIIYPPQA